MEKITYLNDQQKMLFANILSWFRIVLVLATSVVVLSKLVLYCSGQFEVFLDKGWQRKMATFKTYKISYYDTRSNISQKVSTNSKKQFIL